MEKTIEIWLRNKLDEHEKMHSYEVGTDTVRAWMDEYDTLKKNGSPLCVGGVFTYLTGKSGLEEVDKAFKEAFDNQ